MTKQVEKFLPTIFFIVLIIITSHVLFIFLTIFLAVVRVSKETFNESELINDSWVNLSTILFFRCVVTKKTRWELSEMLFCKRHKSYLFWYFYFMRRHKTKLFLLFTTDSFIDNTHSTGWRKFFNFFPSPTVASILKIWQQNKQRRCLASIPVIINERTRVRVAIT